MGDDKCGQQHAGQDERISKAAQQHVKHDRDDRAGRDLGGDGGIGEGGEIVERRPLVRDHLDRAGDEQPAGGAKEAADDGIGQEADGAAGMGEAEHAQQKAGQRGRQRQGDQRRFEKIGAAAGGELLH